MTAQALFARQEEPTARAMLELLRAHYLPTSRPPAGIFAPEIQAPGGAGRADLIWQGCTSSTGHKLVGHEIKATRRDLRAELANGTKSDPWQRYCDLWWLVVPAPGLVDGLDLPPTWGVLAPPSGRRRTSMTVVVPAPELRPVEQAPALRTLATWLHWKLDAARTEASQHHGEMERVREMNRRLRLDAPPATAAADQPGQRLVAEIVARLGGVDFGGRIGTWDAHVNADDVVAALQDLGSLRGRALAIGYEVERAARGLHEALTALNPKTVAELGRAVARFAAAGSEVAR